MICITFFLLRRSRTLALSFLVGSLASILNGSHTAAAITPIPNWAQITSHQTLVIQDFGTLTKFWSSRYVDAQEYISEIMKFIKKVHVQISSKYHYWHWKMWYHPGRVFYIHTTTWIYLLKFLKLRLQKKARNFQSFRVQRRTRATRRKKGVATGRTGGKVTEFLAISQRQRRFRWYHGHSASAIWWIRRP